MSSTPSSKYAVNDIATKTESQPTTSTIGGNPRSKSRVSALDTNKHDPHPIIVPKRSSAKKKSSNSKKNDGLTWGEEASKLSNMVRSKYMHGRNNNNNTDTEVTQNQQKLLYMIHQYSFASMAKPDTECWIRRVPVLVLLFEGIVSQVFDYDYAPSLEVFQANRVYLNITQEGKDDIDDLREKGLIEALTLASSEYDQCLAYTTRRSLSDPILAKMNPDWKNEIDSLLLAPLVHTYGSNGKPETSQYTRDERLLEVFWDEDSQAFQIASHSGYQRISTITNIEDVSYVCSPCVPDCLRPSLAKNSRNTKGGNLERNTDIAAHAVEFIKAHSSDNIQDALDEVLKADGVKILVAEWIPFGSNQMANLNDKLGCVERVQGGLFSSFMDNMPEGTRFEHTVSSSGHMIKILDYNLTEFVNFTADIFFEEDEGIIQIEEFGVSVKKNGSIIYGLHVESVLDRLHSNISMDHLSRLFVDIIQDSSHVAHNLLSGYQRMMLNVLYADRPTLRPKYRILMCEDLNPMMVAEKYMDKEDFENEIKQVIGDTRSGHDLGPREVVIFGRDGLLIAGKRVDRFDSALVSYCDLEGRDTALRVFFRRTFQLSDVIKETRKLIENYDKDPGSMRKLRTLLTKTDRDLILLKELLQYCQKSIEFMLPPPKAEPSDLGAMELEKLINFQEFHNNLINRTQDMFKNIDGLQTSMKALYMLTDANAEAEMFLLVQAQVTNGKQLEDTMKAGERSSSSLEVMNGILAGSLAFDLIDRLSTLYMSYDHEQSVAGNGDDIVGQDFWTWFVWLGRIPGGWLLLNLIAWFFLFLYITNKMRSLAANANGALQCRFTINTKINLDKLNEFLKTKRLDNEDSDSTKHSHTRSVQWTEDNKKAWKGKAPVIEIKYDVANEYLLVVNLDVEQNYGTWTESALRVRFFSMLSNAGILPSESEREPWNDLSRPIYERLHLKRQAQNNGELSDTLLEQLSSQRDSVTENNETYQTQVRRSSIKNFFSGMEIEELQSATPTRLPTIR